MLHNEDSRVAWVNYDTPCSVSEFDFHTDQFVAKAKIVCMETTSK